MRTRGTSVPWSTLQLDVVSHQVGGVVEWVSAPNDRVWDVLYHTTRSTSSVALVLDRERGCLQGWRPFTSTAAVCGAPPNSGLLVRAVQGSRS